MKTINTSRSKRMADDFLARDHPFKRKILVAEQTFSASADIVFRQFCPTREVDWIDGWTADLIWTTTGYVEADCIFTTPDSNILGPGLWIFTRLEPDALVELVRVIGNDVVEHVRIDLAAHDDGTCTGTWTLKFTALNAAGNAMVAALPDGISDPLFRKVIGGLEHFVTTGERMPIGR